MRKALAVLTSCLFPVCLYAGGSSGGTPPASQLESLELMSVRIGQLPKVYANQDEFRRASARLSIGEAGLVPMQLEGTSIFVKKVSGSIVDEGISKEILSNQ